MPRYEDAAEVYERALSAFRWNITDDELSLFGEDAMIKSWRQPAVPNQSETFREQLAHLKDAYVRDGRGFEAGVDQTFHAVRGGEGTPLIVNAKTVVSPPDITIAGFVNLETEDTYVHDNFYSAIGGLMIERVIREEDPSNAIVSSAVREATFHEAEDINNALRQARSRI